MTESINQHRVADFEAFEKLLELYSRKRASSLRLAKWAEAQSRLQNDYTRERAMISSLHNSERIQWLKVPEPAPLVEDFYPGDVMPYANGRCVLVLSLVNRHFEISSSNYRARERERRREIRWAQTLWEGQRRAERDRLSAGQFAAESSGQLEKPVDRETLGLYATVAETPEQLENLFDEKPTNWVFVGLVSVLTQRCGQLQTSLAGNDSLPDSSPNPHRISDARELERFANAVSAEYQHMYDRLSSYMGSAPFRRLFHDRDKYAEPDRLDVIAAADAVLDCYEQILRLTRAVREAHTAPHLEGLVNELARLLEAPIEEIDRWISQALGYSGMLNSLVTTRFAVDQISYPIVLDIEFDTEAFDRILEQLTTMPGPLTDLAFVRRWERAFHSSARYVDVDLESNTTKPDEASMAWLTVGLLVLLGIVIVLMLR